MPPGKPPGMPLLASIMLALLLQPITTNATSSGDGVYICDAHSLRFGCDVHEVRPDGTENRLNCTEETPGYMWWAKRPVRSDAYEVTVGASTSYAPGGQYVPVRVRVKGYGWKYRGLLMHAVNAAGTTVGGWGLPTGAQLQCAPCPASSSTAKECQLIRSAAPLGHSAVLIKAQIRSRQ